MGYGYVIEFSLTVWANSTWFRILASQAVQETWCSWRFRISALVRMYCVFGTPDNVVCDVIDLALRMIIWFNVVWHSERCSAFEFDGTIAAISPYCEPLPMRPKLHCNGVKHGVLAELC